VLFHRRLFCSKTGVFPGNPLKKSRYQSPWSDVKRAAGLFRIQRLGNFDHPSGRLFSFGRFHVWKKGVVFEQIRMFTWENRALCGFTLNALSFTITSAEESYS